MYKWPHMERIWKFSRVSVSLDAIEFDSLYWTFCDKTRTVSAFPYEFVDADKGLFAI